MFSHSQQDQPASTTEPMIVASGSSPGSPYLPGYLIGGDTHSSFAAATPRLWNMANSPPKQRSPSPTTQTPFPVHVVQQASHSPRTFNGRLAGEKVGGPPVQGLFDSFSSPARSEGRSLIHTPGRTPTQAEIDSSFRSRRDGSSLEIMDSDDPWVTVFGFPPGATSYILQQFSQYGTILEHGVASNGNWVHLRYQSKLQAKKALSKNGKIFGDSIMVGVKPCSDKMSAARNVQIEACKENLPTTSVMAIESPRPERMSGIRPLTQAYKMAVNEREVTSVSPLRVPQKTGNLVSKAMECVFNW